MSDPDELLRGAGCTRPSRGSRRNWAGSRWTNALRAAEGKQVSETVKVPVKVVTQENVAGFGG